MEEGGNEAMEGFAGVRVKLGSHCFPLLWRMKGAVLLFLLPPFGTFLGQRVFVLSAIAVQKLQTPSQLCPSQPSLNCPLQVPWEYSPCTCIFISSQDGSCCEPINTYLSLDSCRWTNPNTPTFRYYSLELHSVRWKEIMGGNLFVQITPALR